MNTAISRTMALKHEASLEWKAAADCWDRAIEMYPTKGTVADLDKAKMAVRREACLRLAREEEGA